MMALVAKWLFVSLLLTLHRRNFPSGLRAKLSVVVKSAWVAIVGTSHNESTE